MKSENLNFLEPCGPLQACNGPAPFAQPITKLAPDDTWRLLSFYLTHLLKNLNYKARKFLYTGCGYKQDNAGRK